MNYVTKFVFGQLADCVKCRQTHFNAVGQPGHKGINAVDICRRAREWPWDETTAFCSAATGHPVKASNLLKR